MRIQYNHGTLHRLPAHDAGWWRWVDIVDRSKSGDGVAPKDAHAARALLEHDDDRGEWRTSRRLERYLEEQWGIGLDAGAGPTQAELPTPGAGRTSDESESRVIGADPPDTPARSEPELVQVDLEGHEVVAEVDERAAEEHVGHNVASGEHGPATHVMAERDAHQMTLDAYGYQVSVNRLVRRAGNVYADENTDDQISVVEFNRTRSLSR